MCLSRSSTQREWAPHWAGEMCKLSAPPALVLSLWAAAQAFLYPLLLSRAATAGETGALLAAWGKAAAAPPRPCWLEKGWMDSALSFGNCTRLCLWSWGRGNIKTLKPLLSQESGRHPHCVKKITLDVHHAGHCHLPWDCVFQPLSWPSFPTPFGHLCLFTVPKTMSWTPNWSSRRALSVFGKNCVETVMVLMLQEEADCLCRKCYVK